MKRSNSTYDASTTRSPLIESLAEQVGQASSIGLEYSQSAAVKEDAYDMTQQRAFNEM